MIGASQRALSIQNPSQAGPRTQGEGKGVARAAAAGSTLVAKGGLVTARLVSERSSVSGINPGIG
jgi:hypothetical protein